MVVHRGQADTVGQMSNLMPVDAASISRHTNKLVDIGLLRRRRLRSDRRTVRLSLSDKGKELVPQDGGAGEARQRVAYAGPDGERTPDVLRGHRQDSGQRRDDGRVGGGVVMAGDRVRERVETARTEAARLEHRLRGLTAEQLGQPSACDRWSVADVAAHLAFVAQFQTRMIGRGLQGDDSMPEAARQQGPDAPPASEMIAQGAIGLRERLGDGLMGLLQRSGTRNCSSCWIP